MNPVQPQEPEEIEADFFREYALSGDRDEGRFAELVASRLDDLDPAREARVRGFELRSDCAGLPERERAPS